MRKELAAEDGFTLIELVIVCLILGVILTGLVNVFVSGTQAQADVQGRMVAQQNTRLALDRLEFEARCATSATLVGSGAGVSLSLPSQCSHATGTVTWCVTGGVFTRYTAASCSGAGQKYVGSVISATPFSLLTGATGAAILPRLQVSLTVNQTGRSSDAFSIADAITLQNAARS
jgi:prepilin-type N-terminal cleavage/methylation domain-containing protein